MRSYIFLIFCVFLNAHAQFHTNVRNAVDPDLYEDTVLDPEQCGKQLQHIRQNDSILLTRFIESGLRVPRGLLLGNLLDLGHFPQCLGIDETVHEMSIQGKFCMIRVPIEQNLQPGNNKDEFKQFDPYALRLDGNIIEKLEDKRNHMRLFKTTFGNKIENSRLDPGNASSNLEFQLALCLPKVCTTEEAVAGLLFNLTAIGFQYEENYCRFLDDNPWEFVDYIGVLILFNLALLPLLSTFYEIYHHFRSKTSETKVNELYMTFSALTNCRRLLTIKSHPNNIECLDGIRALAILWVIVGHVFYNISFFPANPIDMYEWAHSYKSIWIVTGTLSVDTFFMLSGLLLVYIAAAKFTAIELLRNLHVFYLNRLLRLFPVLAAVVLFETMLLQRVGDGALWYQYAMNSVRHCQTYWWTTLLYVQNFVNPLEACVGVTWYIAIDVQLHILSPIVLFWVLGRSRTSGWIALTTALLAILTASTAFIFARGFSDGVDYYRNFYVNILTRAPAFVVGMVFGYLIHTWQQTKPNMHRILSWFITKFAISLIGLVVYFKYIDEYKDLDNTTFNDLFDSFLRPCWALALGWIVFACVSGHGGPINWFLCLNIWKIPSKISYAMYLTHFPMMLAYYSSTLQPIYFTVSSAVFDAMGFLWLTFIVSFFVTALIDAPFANLFKQLLKKASPKKLSENGIENEVLNRERT